MSASASSTGQLERSRHGTLQPRPSLRPLSKSPNPERPTISMEPQADARLSPIAIHNTRPRPSQHIYDLGVAMMYLADLL
ncbi:hypothetical protein EVG20_g4471 [Dentipellis fragilis]|uniref:Uncharacterized protein n=1 Tax=Dentipellis fragilis TaxID=205917 RepID=A0A4Y9YVK8_9AGAM|nr:hypothetical protein EVG20_g4471 [Dentipellis fragilis]